MENGNARLRMEYAATSTIIPEHGDPTKAQAQALFNPRQTKYAQAHRPVWAKSQREKGMPRKGEGKKEGKEKQRSLLFSELRLVSNVGHGVARRAG